MSIQESASETGFLEKVNLPRPSLPVVNTALLIEMIGDEWRMPSYEEIRADKDFPSVLGTSAGRLIEQWLKFFDLVERGNEIVKRTAEEGEVEVDLDAFGAWKYAREILGEDFEQRKEMIEATKRAFQVLLGTTAEMEPNDADQARELVKVFEEHLAEESTTAFTNSKIEGIEK
jgi:hypothetical protein